MFSTNALYVLPGTSKDNGKFIEAVCIYSNYHHHMWITSFWDIDDEKQCFQGMWAMAPWGSVHDPITFLSSFPSSADVSQVQLSEKAHPDDLIKILLKPVQILCIIPFGRISGMVDRTDYDSYSVITDTVPKHLGAAGGGHSGAPVGLGIIHCSFEKVSHSAHQ